MAAAASPGQLGKGRRQPIGAKLGNQSTSPMRLSAQRGTGRTLAARRWAQSLGLPARMGRKSHRQRNPSTSGHGQHPPPPGQRNPELLPHRSNQRKDGRNQSQDSRSARQRAFGFRDDDFLKLRLYALHEAKFTFVG